MCSTQFEMASEGGEFPQNLRGWSRALTASSCLRSMDFVAGCNNWLRQEAQTVFNPTFEAEIGEMFAMNEIA